MKLNVLGLIITIFASLPAFSAMVFCTGRNHQNQISIEGTQIAILGVLDLAQELSIHSWNIIESDDDFKTFSSKKSILWSEIRFVNEGSSSHPKFILSGLYPDGFGVEYVDIEIGKSVTESFLVKSKPSDLDSATYMLTSREITFRFVNGQHESLIGENNVCISTHQNISFLFSAESVAPQLYQKLRSLESQLR